MILIGPHDDIFIMLLDFELEVKVAVLSCSPSGGHFVHFYTMFQWFELGLTVGVLYYGGHLVVNGALTGGTLISFILYQVQLGDCLNVCWFVCFNTVFQCWCYIMMLCPLTRIPGLVLLLHKRLTRSSHASAMSDRTLYFVKY